MNKLGSDGAKTVINSISCMKELVFLFIHFNNISSSCIAHFMSMRNEQRVWPLMQVAWLRYESELKSSLKKVVTVISGALSLREMTKAESGEQKSISSQISTAASLAVDPGTTSKSEPVSTELVSVAEQESYNPPQESYTAPDDSTCYFGG
jgi:hypothetical protein